MEKPARSHTLPKGPKYQNARYAGFLHWESYLDRLGQIPSSWVPGLLESDFSSKAKSALPPWLLKLSIPGCRGFPLYRRPLQPQNSNTTRNGTQPSPFRDVLKRGGSHQTHERRRSSASHASRRSGGAGLGGLTGPLLYRGLRCWLDFLKSPPAAGI